MAFYFPDFGCFISCKYNSSYIFIIYLFDSNFNYLNKKLKIMNNLFSYFK